MKVSVSYEDRTYGNSTHSKASEIRITGWKNLTIKIAYKEPQPGRSWDWQSAATVGGAEIHLSIDDAKALANALSEFSREAEKSDPMEWQTYAVLRLRNDHKAELEMLKEETISFEELENELEGDEKEWNELLNP